MTQYNDSNFIPYAQPSGSARPTVVTALAILGIIFGGFMILSSLAGLVLLFLMPVATGANSMGLQIPGMNHSVAMYGLALTPIQLILRAVEIVGCIGALYLKPWGRKMMLVWSVVAIGWAIATALVQAVWITPLTMRSLAQQQPNNPMVNTHVVGIFSIGGAAVSVLFMCIMPTLFLILWNRQDVKNAFLGPRPAA